MIELWNPDQSRKIVERHVVELQLELVSPAHLGNGDDEELTDMSLLADLLEPDRPIIAGTNLAGALRAAVRRWELGHFRASTPMQQNGGIRELSHALFGDPVDSRKSNATEQLQSPLIVDDALGAVNARIEVRDGLRLNPKSRTADEKGLYNCEFWQAGTTFDVRLELVISEEDDSAQLKKAFAIALQCLHDAESQRTVTIGARKRRGFGVVKAKEWKYQSFQLKTRMGLRDWLNRRATTQKSFEDIRATLLTGPLPAKKGREFTASGTFLIDGSLLIRSGSVKDDLDIDMVHLHSIRNGNEVPILSGTTLGGALRSRCWAIAELIGGSPSIADSIVEDLFGPMLDDQNNMQRDKQPRASRVSIQDGLINGATSGDERLIQSRVSIDRFTGGALDTALFDEQPVFGPQTNGRDVVVPLSFTIHDPKEAHIGLFLLALKDLATGDLPVGGEISVGRGLLRLHNSLQLRDRKGDQVTHLLIGPKGETPSEDRKILNGYVEALQKQANGTQPAVNETTGVEG